MTIWEGVLPKKNLTLTQSRHLLRSEKSQHDFLDRVHSKSPYFGRAFQGATLNPHTLWFVEPDANVPLNISRPVLKTSEDAYRLCKEKKWKVRLKGPVERELLFATVLSDDILPFFVRGLRLTVLPALVREDRYVMLTSGEILEEGHEAASDWVKRAERIFTKNSKDEDMSAQSRLNYQSLLTLQNPKAAYVVLYNKSGTNISAGYIATADCGEVDGLETKGFVAESVTYRIYTSTEDEALYLIGVLNSSVVNKAIKPYQTEGVYHGKRDIHRRPFEVCPVPEFVPESAVHKDIVKLSSSAKKTVERWGPEMKGSLANVREQTRDLVDDQIRRIDSLVDSLFSSTASPITLNKKESDQASIF